MAAVSAESILERLRRIKGPDLKSDIVSLGLVSDLFVKDGCVSFSIIINSDQAKNLEPMRLAAEQNIRSMEGVSRVFVALTSHSTKQEGLSHVHSRGMGKDGSGLAGVKRIIAITSGKGGVGKSTLAVNLALAFQVMGLKIGLLDSDIYGPSIPRLLGLTGRPELMDSKKFSPLKGYGLSVMSMGFLMNEETPAIWRGPMIISALTQMLNNVHWGDLDILVVDMPPGTGDAALTMAQKFPLTGVITISTPQDLALIDARKSINMFRRVGVPLLGIIENMSSFFCPHCGERSDIFGHGGVRAEAEQNDLRFLGEIPLHIDIRQLSDAGHPVVIFSPDSPHSVAYKKIAANVLSELSELELQQSKKQNSVKDKTQI